MQDMFILLWFDGIRDAKKKNLSIISYADLSKFYIRYVKVYAKFLRYVTLGIAFET